MRIQSRVSFLLPVLAFQALLTSAPPISAQTSCLGEIQIRIQTPSAALDGVVEQKIDNICKYYVETTSANATVEIEHSDSIIGVEFSSPARLLDTVRINHLSQPAAWRATARLELPSPYTHTVRVAVVGRGGARIERELYIVRKPSVDFVSSDPRCSPSEVCFVKGQRTVVGITGESLEEIDETKGVRVGRNPYPLFRRDGMLYMSLAEDHGLISGSNNTFVFSTRSSFTKDSSSTTDVSRSAFIRSLPAPNIALTFGSDGTIQDTTLLVGESVILETRWNGGNRFLDNHTYTLEENVRAGERNTVGFMQVLEVNSPPAGSNSGLQSMLVRLVGLKASSRPVRRTGVNTLFIYRDTQQIARAQIHVVERPQVDTFRISHLEPGYAGHFVHQGERVELIFSGQNLGAFDSVYVPRELGEVLRYSHERQHPTANELHFEVQVAPGARENIPVRLSSSYAPDTVILIPVIDVQRPRSLGFLNLAYQRRPFLTGLWRSDRDTARLSGADTTILTNSLSGMSLEFDRTAIDQRGLYGPQYLILGAALFSSAGLKLAEDSMRVAIVPGEAGLMSAEGAFESRERVSLDNMVKRLSRFSEAGSHMEVTIRHDSARYWGARGYETTISLENSSRLRIRPIASLLAGALYVGQVRAPDSRLAVPNGTNSDTLVRQVYRRNTDIRAVSTLGSLAAEAAILREDGNPSLARVRLSFFAVENPFTQDRRREFGAALLYPIEVIDVSGVVSFSISVGGGCLSDTTCFGLITPGFDISLTK